MKYAVANSELHETCLVHRRDRFQGFMITHDTFQGFMKRASTVISGFLETLFHRVSKFHEMRCAHFRVLRNSRLRISGFHDMKQESRIECS